MAFLACLVLRLSSSLKLNLCGLHLSWNAGITILNGESIIEACFVKRCSRYLLSSNVLLSVFTVIKYGVNMFSNESDRNINTKCDSQQNRHIYKRWTVRRCWDSSDTASVPASLYYKFKNIVVGCFFLRLYA